MAMLISLFVLAASGLALLFWLDLACRAIRRQRFERDYSAEVAAANQLAFPAIRRALVEEPPGEADAGELLGSLERDCRALTYLLRHAATLHMGRHTWSERLLLLDFQLLRLWVRLNRWLGGRSWRASLLEMAAILEYFGNVVGQRLSTFPGLFEVQ